MFSGFVSTSQVQAQRKAQHIFTLPKEKTKHHPGSLRRHSREEDLCRTDTDLPSTLVQGQQLGSLEKSWWQGENQCHSLLPAATGAAGEGSKGHCAAALPALLKARLRPGQHLTAPGAEVQSIKVQQGNSSTSLDNMDSTKPLSEPVSNADIQRCTYI